jgi:hypothetical protein
MNEKSKDVAHSANRIKPSQNDGIHTDFPIRHPHAKTLAKRTHVMVQGTRKTPYHIVFTNFVPTIAKLDRVERCDERETDGLDG